MSKELLALDFVQEDLEDAVVRDESGRPDCGLCGGTGVRGRLPVWETLPVTPEIEELIEEGGARLVRAINLAGIRAGMTLHRRAVIEHVRRGTVPLKELHKFKAQTPEEIGLWREINRPRYVRPVGRLTAMPGHE